MKIMQSADDRAHTRTIWTAEVENIFHAYRKKRFSRGQSKLMAATGNSRPVSLPNGGMTTSRASSVESGMALLRRAVGSTTCSLRSAPSCSPRRKPTLSSMPRRSLAQNGFKSPNSCPAGALAINCLGPTTASRTFFTRRCGRRCEDLTRNSSSSHMRKVRQLR